VFHLLFGVCRDLAVRLQCMVQSCVRVTFPRNASQQRFLPRTAHQWTISTARVARPTVRLFLQFFFCHFGGVTTTASRYGCQVIVFLKNQTGHRDAECTGRKGDVEGVCAEHLTVESYTIIISLQSYLLSHLLLLVFHHPLTLSL